MIHTLCSRALQPWKYKLLRSAILWCAVLLFLIPSAFTQTTSSISGTVRDSADALVPGAKVTLINQDSKATRSTKSNGEGFFNFLAVPPATYTLEITMANFEAWKVTGIQAHPGDSLTVPKIKLKIGLITQSITVTAEVAGVALNSPEHSTLITSDDIQRLSTVGRDAMELIATQPGFTLNAGTGIQNQGPDYTTTSFGSDNDSAFGANGAAPQQGLVNIVSDGAQVIDPGDMGGVISNINMDQVQEVKVQTSNFGADEAKGPIVISAVGKSGGSAYHGSLYAYARNALFNSNDWVSNDTGALNAAGRYVPIAKTQARYFYPGGSIGGPVKIPGTHFNENKKLTFWAGYEQYVQSSNANGSFGGPTFAFVPTPAMVKGDLSYASLGQAFNVPASDLATNCAVDYAIGQNYSNIGGDCHSPAGDTDQNGNTVPASGQLASINPAVATFINFYPTPNRTPQPVPGSYATDGFNWVKNVLATNNGLQFHSRVDENISDNTKLFAVYNWEKVNSQSPLNNIYYSPPSTVPYPTPLDSNGYSDLLSINLTKTLNASTTNELLLSGIFFNQPEQFADRAKALDTGTPWEAAGYEGGALKNGINQLPRIYSWESTGVPNFSMGYVPGTSRGQFLRKDSWTISDNLTKVFHTHTIKAGVYAEQTRNNQVTLGSDANGTVLFDRYNGCLANQQTPSVNPTTGALITPSTSGLGSTFANFLAGCPGGYNQSSFDPNINMYFNTLEFYATDEWKATSKLTVTLGIRLSHLPPWTDAHGIGAAVWDPTKYNPIQPGVYSTTVTEDTKTWPGISWHKLDSSIPVAGRTTQPLFYSPRVGLAYDVYGNGKTVFRGGWGAYYNRDSTGISGGAMGIAIDLVDHGLTGNNTCTLDQLMNSSTKPTGTQVLPCGYYGGNTAGFETGAAAITSGSTISVSAVDPKDNQEPVTYNYNFTLDQQARWGTKLELAYVGNQSTHLSTLGNLQNHNVIPLGAFFGPDPLTHQTNPASNISSTQAADYRPYPNYNAVDVPEHTNWANYNAMQVSLNKQRGSLAFGINYTWSKAMGVRGNYDTGGIGDPVNPHNDYGILSYDRPQAINFTYSYQEGKKFKGNRELGWVLNNWELSGVTSIQSGPDLAIYGGTNFGFSASGGYYTDATRTTLIGLPIGAAAWLGSSDYTLQPIATCDPRHGFRKSVGQVRQYANGNCFALPAQGTQGWWNLPDVHGPAYEKSDLSVYKDVQINERQNLQFRMAGFNFLNHPISSFTNNNLNALNLTFADPTCNTTTGAGCLYSQQAAFGSLTLQNSGFGKTPFKWGVRIVEFGVKYNF
ncbi:MAG: carboxypeptidase-like regulatory domain-containing protein [Acidobacteriota bacterium]|nr:carboxypeptidase-like regulatory domain-containing protein [Acidobacteriota bacterium]